MSFEDLVHQLNDDSLNEQGAEQLLWDYYRNASGHTVNPQESREGLEIVHNTKHKKPLYDPIAVIGMSLRVPGANDVHEFWRTLIEQRSAIRQVPKSRWRWQDYYGDASIENNTTDVRYGGFIEDVEYFDAQHFGISDDDALYLDPQSRMLFTCCYEMLEDAGYGFSELSGEKVSAFIGLQRTEFMNKIFYELNRASPAVENGSFHGFMVNRLGYHFNWKGPSFAVNSACASSSVAIHQAVTALQTGQANYAVAGGSNLFMNPLSFIAERVQGGLTAKDYVSAFDSDADGVLLGEGCGVILLKRLDDAHRDNDHIYGVIKGSAIGNSGRTFYPLAPSPEGHEQVIAEALTKAALDPSEIDYIEGQGASTQISDQAEIMAFQKTFCSEPCAEIRLTNVKANIGHLENASGVIAIIKQLLSMNSGQVPGIINIKRLNSGFSNDIRVTPVLSNEHWHANRAGYKAASIHNFGAGGINTNIILEKRDPSVSAMYPTQGHHLCLFSAPSADQLMSYVYRFLDYCKSGLYRDKGVVVLNIADVAFSLAKRRKAYAHRLAVIASNLEELIETLENVADNVVEGKENDAVLGTSTSLLLSLQAQDWLNTGDLDKDLKFAGRHVPLPPLVLKPKKLWPFDDSSQTRSIKRKSLSRDVVELQPPSARPSAQTQAKKVTQSLQSIDLEQTRRTVSRIIANILSVDEKQLDGEEVFGNFGFNSLSLKSFANELSEVFHLNIEAVALFNYSTIHKLSAYIVQQTENKQRPVEAPVIVPIEEAREELDNDAIAIVGMSAVLPGSKDLETFWQNQLDTKNNIVTVPNTRWNWETHFGDPIREPAKSNSKWGGFISDIDQFDPLYFGISPYEADFIDPQHRLFTKSAWQSIVNAGYNPRSFQGQSLGVFAGVQFQDYQKLMSDEGIVNAHVCTGNAHTMLPNRLSYLLDVHGPSEAIDTACSSSLVAINRGVHALRNGECKLAIVGGVNLMLIPDIHIMGSQLGVLSPTGQCRTLDDRADGYVRGEGVGTLFLKPLHQALKDKDHIHAIIKGTSANHGGKASSLTAPNSLAQSSLMIATIKDANVEADSISYIEMHGTGTELGDPIEIEGIKRAFAELGVDHQTMHCALGSVKANIGHLEAAAGVAGMVNVILSMQAGKLPGLSNFTKANSHIKLEGTPFHINNRLSDWNPHAYPRRAMVNSFGFGGTNASVVLEEYVHKNDTAEFSVEEVLIPLSTNSKKQLVKYCEELLNSILQHRTTASSGAKLLWDIAFTLQQGRETQKVRFVLRVSTLDELCQSLRGLIGGQHIAIAEHELPDYALRWLTDGVCNWPKSEKANRIPLPMPPWNETACWYEEKKPQVSERLPSTPKVDPFQNVLFLQPTWQQKARTQATSGIKSSKNKNIIVIGSHQHELLSIQQYFVEQGYDRSKMVFVEQANEFNQRSEHFYTINHEDYQEVENLIRHLGKQNYIPNSVFVIDGDCSFDNENLSVKHAVSDNPLKRLFNWSKTLMVNHFSKHMEIYYVFGSEALNLCAKQNAVAAFAKSVYLENNRFRCNVLQLDRPLDSDVWMRRLLEEWQGSDGERPEVIRYRRTQRLVKGLGEIPTPTKTESIQFQEGGVYVLPGGAGELGYRLAYAIVERFKAKVILQGRSPINDTIKTRIESIQLVAQRNEDVLYQQCDIADFKSVNLSLQEVISQFGSINGVLLLVTDHKDAYLFNKEWKDFESVTASKVSGTINYDTATQHLPLDFFVVFSSQAVLGMAGGIDYAYGCEFQNQLIHARQQLSDEGKRYGVSKAICWSRWKWDKYVTKEFDEWVVRLGYDFLDMDLGMQCLSLILASQLTEVFVLYGDRKKMLSNFDLNKGLLIESTDEASSTVSEAVSATFDATVENIDFLLDQLSEADLQALSNDLFSQDQLVALTDQDKLERLQNRISDIICKLLKLDGIENDANFTDVGLDSVIAVSLIDQLGMELKIDISPAWLVEDATVFALAKRLLAETDPPFKHAINDAPPPTEVLTLPTVEPSPRRSSTSHEFSRAEIERVISKIICEQLKLESIDSTAEFSELGLDSVMAIKLISRFEDELDIEISPTWLVAHSTVHALSNKVTHDYDI